MDDRPPSYPIELDLRGRRALVVGLGSVGRRKALGLLSAGALVVGVDPAPIELDSELAGVAFRPEPYQPEHLRGMTLAFAAATPEVNRLVAADARASGVLVNVSSEPGLGDFHVPAVWRSGGLTLAVSTSGASPAFAAALRDRAAHSLGRSPGELAALFAALRPIVLASLDDAEARRRVLADWADPRWLALYEQGGAEAVRAEAARALRQRPDGDSIQ